MDSKLIFNLLHNAVESHNFGQRISQKQMAQKLNIPMRTYQDWKLGNSKPIAVTKAFEMLTLLDEDEILSVVKKLKKLKGKDDGKLNI